MHVAASFGREGSAKLLIAHSVNLYTKNKAGYTPLQMAEQNGHKDVVELLHEHSTSNN